MAVIENSTFDAARPMLTAAGTKTTAWSSRRMRSRVFGSSISMSGTGMPRKSFRFRRIGRMSAPPWPFTRAACACASLMQVRTKTRSSTSKSMRRLRSPNHDTMTSLRRSLPRAWMCMALNASMSTSIRTAERACDSNASFSSAPPISR